MPDERISPDDIFLSFLTNGARISIMKLIRKCVDGNSRISETPREEGVWWKPSGRKISEDHP